MRSRSVNRENDRSGAFRRLRVEHLPWLALLGLLLTTLTAVAAARPGGGESYGGAGGGDSGGGGGGGGAEIGLLIDLMILCVHYPALGVPLLVIAVLFFVIKARHERKNKGWSAGVPPAQVRPARHRAVSRTALAGIRAWDPAFSVVLFEDFLYTLYGEMHRARAQLHGPGAMMRLGPYLNQGVQQAISDPSLQAIEGVVIGAMRYVEFHTRADHVEVVAEFESNLTEVRNGQRTRWYVVDRISLKRARGARSRPPARSRTLDCPNCGAALEAVRGNVCSYCREQVSDGRFDWCIHSLKLIRSESQPPLLTGNVEERGTNLPTITDGAARQQLGALSSKDPNVSENALHARVGLVFNELQVGWSTQDLPKIRGYVSDNLFQYFAYWVDTYRVSGARNITENARISRIDLANVLSDAYFDSVTLRLFASGLDYTLDAGGKLLKGSRKHERPYSEYWTFIRGTSARGQARTEPSCPSCGAPLRVSMAGNCEYCSAKVVSGDFDWVLSRIEQDEAYSG